jgi:subtilisin family serine protease
MTDAIAYARAKDVVVAAAAGNHASAVACPAHVGRALRRGRRQGGQVWASSNRGPQLSVVAPSVAITSTLPTGMGGYGTLTGTSMATPMASGAAAIIASAAPPSVAEIHSALISTARDLGPAGRDDAYGARHHRRRQGTRRDGRA